MLPHTGAAHISYIFGYHSKKLIQVNILWVSDRSASADEEIVGTANALRDYFASENFRPDSVVANRRLAANTILVFRGSDDQQPDGFAGAERGRRVGPPGRTKRRRGRRR